LCLIADTESFLEPDSRTTMLNAVVDPLYRFPVFRTSNPEELRHFGSTLFGAAGIDLKGLDAFEARVNLVKLQETGLAFGATTADLAIDNVAADYIRLQIAHSGRATTSAEGRTTDINDQQFAITPAGCRSRTVCEAGHERLTLRLSEQALLQRLTALLGAKPNGEMTFQPAIPAGEPHAQILSHLIRFLAQQLDSTASQLPAAVCRELEHAIQIAFLYACRNSFLQVRAVSRKTTATLSASFRPRPFCERANSRAVVSDEILSLRPAIRV
jgi:AraC-binding-like domain